MRFTPTCFLVQIFARHCRVTLAANIYFPLQGEEDSVPTQSTGARLCRCLYFLAVCSSLIGPKKIQDVDYVHRVSAYNSNFPRREHRLDWPDFQRRYISARNDLHRLTTSDYGNMFLMLRPISLRQYPLEGRSHFLKRLKSSGFKAWYDCDRIQKAPCL